MKKISVMILVFSLVFLLLFVPLAVCANDTGNETNGDNENDADKIELGFECLEEQIGEDCAGASNVQEIALTILASPENVLDTCVDKLKDVKRQDHWKTSNSVRDTALAILALRHVGEGTEDAEEWLLSQNQSTTDLIWYLQEDSTGDTQCKISYDGDDYTVNINENKKIDSGAGICLSLAQSDFWLKISSSCYDKEFKVSCNKDFIANLLYQQKNSNTIYVLEDTESEDAFGEIFLSADAKCFANSGICDYEGSLWATLALLKSGYNVEDFIPYVVALADTNEQYLPKAFVYMITGYDDYGTQLLEDRQLGNYWEADATAYDKFYDTSLAILALGSSSEKTISKNWLLFSQDSDGCWDSKNLLDTAMILWALEGRIGVYGGFEVPGVTYCSEADYFCIPEDECPEDEKFENYFCAGSSKVCCENENLKTCAGYGGVVCGSGYFCVGDERKASDADYCCVGECVQGEEESECEEMGYICKDFCSENQEEIDYDCDNGVCCRTKTSPRPISEEGRWWIIVLIIGILVVLGIIIWLLRKRLRLLLFKISSKFRKDRGRKGGSDFGGGFGSSPPAVPPRPGFPPIKRQVPIRQQPRQARGDKKLDNVFSKLKDMAR